MSHMSRARLSKTTASVNRTPSLIDRCHHFVDESIVELENGSFLDTASRDLCQESSLTTPFSLAKCVSKVVTITTCFWHTGLIITTGFGLFTFDTCLFHFRTSVALHSSSGFRSVLLTEYASCGKTCLTGNLTWASCPRKAVGETYLSSARRLAPTCSCTCVHVCCPDLANF